MKRIKLTRHEKRIEKDLLEGHYVNASEEGLEELKTAIEAHRKNAVLHIRINEGVLQKLKDKSKKLGIKYQTFIAEILRNVAQS